MATFPFSIIITKSSYALWILTREFWLCFVFNILIGSNCYTPSDVSASYCWSCVVISSNYSLGSGIPWLSSNWSTSSGSALSVPAFLAMWEIYLASSKTGSILKNQSLLQTTAYARCHSFKTVNFLPGRISVCDGIQNVTLLSLVPHSSPFKSQT